MRLLNRVLAALLSLALAVAGTLLIIEVFADRINHRPAVVHWHNAYHWLARTPWQQGSVRVVCIVLVVLGLVLLVAELKRSRVSRLKVESGPGENDPIDTAYTRRGVTAAVRAAVTDVDGISSAQVTVKRRSVQVQAVTSAGDKQSAQQLREPAQAAAQRRLDELALVAKPSLRVRTTARSS